MLDMFIFETTQLLEQLEQTILTGEKTNLLHPDSVNEIFRIMHTIKGSSAMMLFNNISTAAHSMEDLFYYIREEIPKVVDNSRLTDLILNLIDFIKSEISNIESGNENSGNPDDLIESIKAFLKELKGINKSGSIKKTPAGTNGSASENQKCYIPRKDSDSSAKGNCYEVRLTFEDGCEMENIRAFSIIHNLQEIAEIIEYYPADIVGDDSSKEIIRQEGFLIKFTSDTDIQSIKNFFSEVIFMKDLEINLISEENKNADVKNDISIVLDEEPLKKADGLSQGEKGADREINLGSIKQNYISVKVEKLDMLLDLVGELVISESMVTRNPEITGLQLESFHKAASQLNKITSEIQDTVMSIRMIPLSTTFQKMNRLIRDMSKKLGKDVELEIIGEGTEVDKNIIEHITDPLMHIIRNSMDHGIESSEERISQGKNKSGKITLEARNSGGDVWIIVKDDGKGLDRDKILKKAKEKGLLKKEENELTDNEIYSFIFEPGFSTKENVTEFSGRGVGMDVVMKNIKSISGNVLIDSNPGKGSTFSIKIPLTLAIINGMVVSVGNSSYIIPTDSIRESFKADGNDVFSDPDGNEMILIRGICYQILRLNQLYNVNTEIAEIKDGIVIMIEDEYGGVCLFVDSLIGEQQVVVKALPAYVKKIWGIAGCTLLGDGSISLILDAASFIKKGKEG